MNEPLVKIKRDSIKRNPRAFSTQTIVSEGQSISFKIEGATDLPDFLTNGKNAVITGQSWGMDLPKADYIEAYLLDYTLLDKVRQIPGTTITVDNQIRTFRHMPEREYFYEYEDAEVECRVCGRHLHISEIVEEEIVNGDGDEYSVEVCPQCSTADSFPRKYENVNEVIKNENIKL